MRISLFSRLVGWKSLKNPKDPDYLDFLRVKQKYLARDKQGQLVFLADSAFSIEMVKQKYPQLKLHFTSEFDK